MPHMLENTTLDKLGIGRFRYEFKPHRGFVYSSKGLARIFGIPHPKDVILKHLGDFIVNKKDAQELLEKFKEKKAVHNFETSCLTHNRKVKWVMIHAIVSHNGQGSYAEGIIQDISSCKDGQENAHLVSDALQSILDSIPDAIYFKDRKNRLTRVNKFYADGFGGKVENILGKTDFDFFPEEQARQMFNDDNQILKTGKPIVGKIERTLLPNGTWNQVITTKVPIYDTKGKIIGTMGITRDMTAHANLEFERHTMVLNALAVLSKALEMRDPYTQTHARDVSLIAKAIARKLGYDDNKLLQIEIAAELHDLGKISIPLDILIKPGKLSDLEYRLIKEHTNNCHRLIKDVVFPFPLAEIIYQHHERLDGSGYPRGLKGKQILPEARILAVADVLEAMTNHRPYRPALGLTKAVKELKQGSGKKYDAKVVDITLKLVHNSKGKFFWVQANGKDAGKKGASQNHWRGKGA